MITIRSSTVHTFSYLDDIADLDKIRGRQPLRRDEEVSGSDVTPSSVVIINYDQFYSYDANLHLHTTK